MKRFFAIALAAFGLVACVQENVTELPSGGAISFENAFIDNATRAAVDPSTTTASLGGFDVWGYVKSTNGVVFDNVDVTKNGGEWSYTGTQYWAPEQPYFFAALAPMNSTNVSDLTLATGAVAELKGLGKFTFTNVDGSEDLLYATAHVTAKGAGEDNDPVAFTFKHLLSKVKFTFSNGFPTENMNVVVTNVKMTAPAKATIDVNVDDYAKGWELGTEEAVTLAFGNVEQLAMGAAAEATDERLTIPAAAEYTYTIDFDVEVLVGTESVYTLHKTSTVTGVELEMGKAYNFAAELNATNLNLDDIEFAVTEVEDWVTGGDVPAVPVATVTIDGVDKTYGTFEEAWAAAIAANGATITLTENVVLDPTVTTRAAAASATLTVPAGKELTLDLAGKTISLAYEQTNTWAMIDNNGTLTIKGNGSIIYSDTAVQTAYVNYASNVIKNNGKLTINEGVNLINNSNPSVAEYGYPHVIDTNVNLVINGGTFTNKTNYCTIRIWCTEDTNTEVTINGGTFNGSIDFHNVSAKANKGTLTINDGTFNADTYTNAAVRLLGFGVDVDEMNAYLKGGVYNGKVYRSNYTDGEFNSQVFYISGGKYSTNVNEFVVDGKGAMKVGDYYEIVEGAVTGVSTAAELQAALDAAVDGEAIQILADIDGDVIATQKAGVKITIEGSGYNYKGTITVDGKSKTYVDAGLTIKDLTFNAEALSTGVDACIRLGDGTDATRYTCNVTVEGCTFDVPLNGTDGKAGVGVKSYTGGDKNLTIKNCVATANAHSLVQAKGIDGILIEGCTVNSKNGMNFNNSTNVVVDDVTTNTKGYAARFGESSGGAGAAEVYTIKNSTLKSACEEGDAVIMLRGTADNSTLNINNTTLEGDPQITNKATDAKIYIDGTLLIANQSQLNSAIVDGGKYMLAAGEYTMPSAAKGKTLTFTGAGANSDVVINVVPGGQSEAGGQLDYNLDGSTVTFNNLTIKTNSQLYAGYARLSATYNNCVIQNTYNLGTGNSAFYGCTINITNEYLRVGAASSALFDGCTFNTDGRAILVFQDGTTVAQTVTVKDCTFNATAAANTWNGIHVAAVSIDGSQGGTYTVNLEGTNTVDSDFNGLWQIKAGETNVTVNE